MTLQQLKIIRRSMRGRLVAFREDGRLKLFGLKTEERAKRFAELKNGKVL